MASLLDLYGSLYRPQTGSADAQDETTGGILDQYNRNRAYDNSVFGQVTKWLNKQRGGLEDATPFNPVVMALDGAQTMTNWMGASAFPEKVEPVDMLAPLGMAAVGSLATPRNAVGIFGGRLARTADMADQSRGSMPTTAAERADMLAKNRMELGLSLINGDMETAAALRQQREAIQMHPLDGYAGMSPKFRGANVDGKMVVEGGTASENDRLFGPGKWVFYSNADRSSLPGLVAGAVDGESESEFDRLLRLYGFIQ